MADIETLTSMPDTATHRKTDERVFAAASSKVKVAIISPTYVYGLGPSRVHPTPITLPNILKVIRKLSSGFTISAGKNLQSWIHVSDQARVYLLLLNYALGVKEVEPGEEDEIWGPQAYYFGASEEIAFADFMTSLVPIAKQKGLVQTEDIKQLNIQEAAEICAAEDEAPAPDSWSMHIAIGFGVDMRSRSSRAKRFGWQPKEPPVGETLEKVISKFLEHEK
ncbi:MAG: hypothetical protein M1834_000078 [Cirrosporium novae-zelandiae]|nr:MAG: hypothetical protein M1834_000078 [Cirrosporium novae-zelandiae]